MAVTQDYSLSELNNLVRAYFLELNVQKVPSKKDAVFFHYCCLKIVLVIDCEFASIVNETLLSQI